MFWTFKNLLCVAISALRYATGILPNTFVATVGRKAKFIIFHLSRGHCNIALMFWKSLKLFEC